MHCSSFATTAGFLLGQDGADDLSGCDQGYRESGENTTKGVAHEYQYI
jgi:hypothetical protein